MSKNVTINIKEMQLDGDTAIRIMKCLKQHEYDIYVKFKDELVSSINITDTCPKCGCQIKDPFTGTAIIHDIDACKGIKH